MRALQPVAGIAVVVEPGCWCKRTIVVAPLAGAPVGAGGELPPVRVLVAVGTPAPGVVEVQRPGAGRVRRQAGKQAPTGVEATG